MSIEADFGKEKVANPVDPGPGIAPRPGFEPGSRARQARMIGRYTTGAANGEMRRNI